MKFEGHTPGPWGIIGEKDLLEDGIDDLMIVAFQVGPDSDDDDIYIVNIGSDGPFACINESEHSKTNLANAHLIAAAPRLVAEREKLIGALEEIARFSPTGKRKENDGSTTSWGCVQCGDIIGIARAVLAEVKE